ncbi:hypothetical protein TMatcc_008437 [Talaromyces marneffei ATCC 18224]|uniref:MARVEL domain-containing protein n=2 Tax=Talaromyces marneffei TaxID=37727 RepID=B6QM08_TALMQ|nr:uncharacterized protein EYB26_007775 [Talaromyces marneffei]EEA22135.1 conserved hypothetical protein [Talaromyces marneffei ATCC 18224]KAE8550409.1 hypothetical protein EYB25_006635 [Talaromyces marneffei]QGA20075.1 hypothetical protein EYB26_007775 [Talaromyces marneffei]
MAVNVAVNKRLDYALRALQLIFAIIVMGSDGHAIREFHGHTVYEHFQFGNYYDYVGVPDAWSFLLFCAVWTLLIVIFHLIAGIYFADRALIGYIRVGVEAVAVLSWLAGFIAVAIQIPTGTCSEEKNSCALLKAATVFGACEWLLFMFTATQTFKLVFNSTRKPKTSPTRPAADV